MRTYKIATIPGDGIGKEVVPAGQQVLQALADTSRHFAFSFQNFDWGGDHYRAHGMMMPADGLDALRHQDAILFGSAGDPQIPDHITLWGLRLKICQGFDQYANVRPTRILPGIDGPLKRCGPSDLDWVIVRENSEGEYAGVGGRVHQGHPIEAATDVSIMTRAGVERIMRYAFKLAQGRPRKLLTVVTKSNAQRHAMVMWDEIALQISREFPDVRWDKELVDAATARMVMRPATLDTIVATNLHADILSDLAAALAGSLGIAPTANIDPERRYPSMFEPIHGSAFDIMGQGLANPIGTFWSAVMLLDHLGEAAAARQLMAAIEQVTANPALHTRDLGGQATTAQVTAAVCALLTPTMALTSAHAFGPTDPPLRDITLGALLAWAAETTPERIALVFGTPDPAQRRQWTYAALYAQSQRTARALLTHFQPGERVAAWSANRPEWVLMEFGCALAGLVLVTVNPAFRAQEVQYVLNQSKAAGVVVADQFRGNAMLATVQQVAPACPMLRHVIRFDDWDRFITAGDDTSIVLPDVQPRDAVMIQYTSGTTGFPKGALLHHHGLANNGAHTADRMGVADGSVWITTMPLFHTGGCVCCVIGAVSRRCTQVLLEAFEPGLVLELFETYKGNAMVGVPTMLIAMLEHPRFAQTDLSSVRAICAGGSTVPAALVTRLEQTLGAPFTIVFGQTECSPVAQMTRPDDSVQDKAETLGAPMPHVEVKIIDPATGATLPVGAIGEYCTRGYHVMHGYFDMPEATAAAIDADGWLHTGDLCAMDARGYCTVEGRLKDMIIRGGENIYPRELEELLFRHPSVGSVAVVGLPDARMGEEVAAFLRPAPGAVLDKAALIDFMRAHLAPHKTPRRWFSVAEFPLTGSGKIQKFRLRELQQAGTLQEL